MLPTKLNINAASIPKASSLARIPATITSHSPARFPGVATLDTPASDDDDNSSNLSYSDEQLGEWIDGTTLIATDDVDDMRYLFHPHLSMSSPNNDLAPKQKGRFGAENCARQLTRW